MTPGLTATVADVLARQLHAAICAAPDDCAWAHEQDNDPPTCADNPIPASILTPIAVEVTNALTTGAVLVDRDTLDQWIEDALTQGIAPAAYVFGVLDSALPEDEPRHAETRESRPEHG